MFVALTGIGVYTVVSRLGWSRNHIVRAVVMLVAIGVAGWNLRSYFVDYAAMPRWNQGPFFASQRWYGPLVRAHVGPETKIIFARDIEDPWTLKLHLSDIVDIHHDSPAFYWARSELDEHLVNEIEGFCNDNEGDPVIFVFRIETPNEIVETVMQKCNMTDIVGLPCEEGIVRFAERRVILAKRAGASGDPGVEQEPPTRNGHDDQATHAEEEDDSSG